MSGPSRRIWNGMKALGRKLEKCRDEMAKFKDLFEVREEGYLPSSDDEDVDVFDAYSGIVCAVETWWTVCDRYLSGDLVEAKIREAGSAENAGGR